MVDERAGPQVAARIGFAERWLVRARRQVAEGNVARGVLTLVLADAEVRHALEAAGALPTRRRMTALVLPLLAVLAAAGVVAAALLPAPVVETTAGAPAVVSLASRVGLLLELVPMPLSTPVIPVITPQPPAPMPVRAPAPRRHITGSPKPAASRSAAVHSSPITVAPPALAPGAPVVTRAAPAPAAPVAVQPAPAPSMALSAGELIDLVLAAERALRSEPARR